MYKLIIKREKQFFIVQSKINILINGDDNGEIKNGETRTIEVSEQDIKVKFEHFVKSTELNLKLTKDENITVRWNKTWGNIQVKVDKEVVLEEKKETSAKNYFLYVAGGILFVIFIYYANAYLWG